MLTTIKIRDETRRTLRMIAALTDESMVNVIDRLARAELQRLSAEPDEGDKWQQVPTRER